MQSMLRINSGQQVARVARLLSSPSVAFQTTPVSFALVRNSSSICTNFFPPLTTTARCFSTQNTSPSSSTSPSSTPSSSSSSSPRAPAADSSPIDFPTFDPSTVPPNAGGMVVDFNKFNQRRPGNEAIFDDPQESGMNEHELQSTGNNAMPGDIPRNGPYPLHPYLEMSEAERNATDGRTCPSWAWDNESTEAHRASARVYSTIPFPRPLLPVYRHASYRPPPELHDVKRRMLHVFTLLLCAGVGSWMVISMDHDTPQNKGNHVFKPIQLWYQRKKGELFNDPSAAAIRTASSK